MHLSKTLLLAGAVTASTACNMNGSVDEDEAQMIFTLMYTVSQDVVTQAYGQAPASKAWTFEQDDAGGYTFGATIEGSGLWTGTIELSGALSHGEGTYNYSYDMAYIDVTSNGVTLNGTLALDLSMLHADDGSFSYSYALAGEMEATGDAMGTADFDYTMDVVYDATTGAYTYEMSGDIAGYEVSGMQ
jgi:hypothetical protein